MAVADQVIDAPTPFGPARLHLWSPEPEPAGPAGSAGSAAVGAPLGRLVLGHGAGGGIGAPDLTAVRAIAVAAGWQVVLVEQPWRVAGKRIAPAPARLDVGWLAAFETLAGLPAEAGGLPPGRPLVLGGRSAGARVACRTAQQLQARAVCCLAFPLHPPGRPDRSRAAELAAAGVPVLVVQGSRDPFGVPAEILEVGLAGVEVAEVPGDHGLARPVASVQAVAQAVAGRLPGWALDSGG